MSSNQKVDDVHCSVKSAAASCGYMCNVYDKSYRVYRVQFCSENMKKELSSAVRKGGPASQVPDSPVVTPDCLHPR